MNEPKTTTMTETLTTMVLRAEALAAALQALHRQACEGDPMLAILVSDLIPEAREIGMRRAKISAVSRPAV